MTHHFLVIQDRRGSSSRCYRQQMRARVHTPEQIEFFFDTVHSADEDAGVELRCPASLHA
jgi:hypothetical protein